jgi:hypothetical protein
MTEQDVRQLVVERGKTCASQGSLARELGMSQANLSVFLRGKAGPSEALLKALGLVAVLSYCPIAEPQPEPVQTKPAPKRKQVWKFGDWPKQVNL